jgi:hypothetical protein
MDETTLLSLTSEELYRVFIAKARDLKTEKIIKDSDIKRVRYGVEIQFSLSKYFIYKNSEEYGLFRIKPKTNMINLDGKGLVNLDKFNEELEERNGIMLNALLDYYSEDDDLVGIDLGSLKND